MSDSDGLDRDGMNQQPPSSLDAQAVDQTLHERLAAVERAITEEGTVADLSTTAERHRRLEALTERVEEIESCLDELDAATQALRGYVGSVRAVNEEVEKRADLALAIAERTERNAGARSSDADEGSETPEMTPVESATDRLSESQAADDPTESVVGAGDGDVAAAVRDSPTDSDIDDSAVSAAVPDDGSDPDDGVLSRLRDVL